MIKKYLESATKLYDIKVIVLLWLLLSFTIPIIRFSFVEHKQLDHYYFLANSLVRGKLDVTEQIYSNFSNSELEYAADYSIYNGKYYVYIGLFPALLTIPLIPLGPSISMSVLVLVFAYLNIRFLHQIKSKYLDDNNYLVTIFLVIASPLLTTLTFRGPWYLAGLISSAFGFMFVWYYLINKRSWGIFFLLPLFLTRPSTLFWFLIPLYKVVIEFINSQKEKGANILNFATTNKSLKWLLLTGITSLAIFGLYNYARFGNPVEAGYKYFYILQDEYRIHRNNANEDTIDHFFSNALYMLFNPPIAQISNTLRYEFPYYELSRFGVGLIFVMPWFLMYFLLNRRIKKDWIFLLVTSLTLLFIFSFTGEGSFQIGPRYANDFYPLLVFVFLRWLSENKKYKHVFYKLLTISVIVNIYFLLLVQSGNIRSG